MDAAVHEYLTEFGIQTGIETKFSYLINGNLNLASVAEVQLVCILQEALTNVRKHAKAGHVVVTITKEVYAGTDQIHMQIVDNGSGFVQAISRRNFGLQTMRERAESVGGTLVVTSAEGNGTRIDCNLPCLQQERLKKQSVVIN